MVARNVCAGAVVSAQILTPSRQFMAPTSMLKSFATLVFVCGWSASAATTDLDESIRQVRMGTLVVKAPAGSHVRVEQVRHEFWFGAALANRFAR